MASENNSLKSTQAVVDVLKNIALLVALVYAFFSGREALRTVFNQITSGERVATEMSIGKEGITLKLEEAKRSLTAAVNSQAKTEGRQDQPVSTAAKDILGALERTDSALAEVSKSKTDATPPVAPTAKPMAPSGIWVYLGIEKNGSWNPNYFKLSGSPKVGESVKSWTEVYKRDSKPIYDESLSDWKLGKVIGVLHPGELVSILELDQIKSDNGGTIWWARIR